MSAKLLDPNDPEFDEEAKEIDKKSKKKRFTVKWFTEKNKCGETFKTWLSKKKEDGIAFCRICNSIIKYKSMGKKALHQHANGASRSLHKKNANISGYLVL